MKSKHEIERVHKLLDYVMERGQIENHDTKMKVIAASDVLYWVLNHTHPNTFVEYLNRIEKEIRAEGGDVKRENN